MSEEMKLPKHWKVAISADILDIRDGTHDTPKYVTSNGVPLITSKNLKENKIDFEKVSFISEFDHTEISKRSKVETGDILFAMIGTIGNPAIIKGDANFSIKNVGLFKKNESIILPAFLVNFLRSSIFNKQLAERKLLKGTTQRFIPLGNLRIIHIPLPPLPEQQAIVSRIEELLSDLENGKQQLQTAQQQLKIYRQSLLKWAFEGKLTNKKVKEGELPKGWKIVELRDVVNKISDGPFGSHLKSVDYVNDGIRVIRLENIGVMEFRDEYKTYVTPEKYETIKNHTVGKGDIIFSSFISESIRAAILPNYIEKAINKADCFLVRVSETKINKHYLAFYFSTKAMQNQLVSQIHGATRPRINTTQLKTAKVPLPTYDEQQLIVSELESKLTICDKIADTITQSLQQTETLRQSILKKAFEGKLVTVQTEKRKKLVPA